MDLTSTTPVGTNANGAPTADQASMIVQTLLKAGAAWVQAQQSSGMIEQETFTIDLTTARAEVDAIEIPYAFKSCVVRDGSDNNAYFYLKPYSNNVGIGSSKLRNNSVWDAGDFPCPKCYLWWPAQAGKNLVVEFHLRSRVVPGNTQQVSYVTEGSSATTATAQTVTATAAALLGTDNDRKVTTIQNQGAVSIYVGDSTVTKKGGASPGIEIAPGATFYWKNTGPLYAVTDSASNTAIAVMTEK